MVCIHVEYSDLPHFESVLHNHQNSEKVRHENEIKNINEKILNVENIPGMYLPGSTH